MATSERASAAVRTNPFNVTKAVDFSDEEIMSTWVDFRAEGGFVALANPRSPMPRILLGGKGGGRTHLMRYFSQPVQELRHAGEAPDAVLNEGYFGIYLRCSGLNAGRFGGKGVSDDVWAGVFAYYMDLWLAQLALATCARVSASLEEFREVESSLCADIVGLFDTYELSPPATTAELIDQLHAIQRDLDFAINNAALARELSIVIRASRGRLPLGVPQVVAQHMPRFASVTWLYLIDELENLTLAQQRYVQTLIREKESPASFMLGTRLYGLRTFTTYSADEENKEGSEYETFHLDRFYIQRFSQFRQFCNDLVAQRLIEGGFADPPREAVVRRLPEYFFNYPSASLGEPETEFVLATGNGERKYFAKLAQQLDQHRPLGTDALGVSGIIEALRNPQYPLLEKLNVFLVYQAWAARRDIAEAADHIGEQSRKVSSGEEDRAYQQALTHHRSDLLAQLLQEYDQRQRYLGPDVFVRMAGGLPRNLLIILKAIYRWALFNGESAFATDQITERSQRQGVLDAANWFFEDATVVGAHGQDIQGALNRVSNLFRALRFSDKPPEVSLSTFSVDLSSLTTRAQETIGRAGAWSLLLPVPTGQKDRNTRGLTDKLQVNPMLCPRWDLPLARRGTIALSPAEANAIFDPVRIEAYEAVVRARVARATVPFSKPDHPAVAQESLPGEY
jgi:hypothetical protein